MRCRRCEADNPQSARFCDSCGAELDRACGACGASNRAGARFCNRCGSKIDAGDRQAAAPAAIPGYLAGEGERKLVTVLFADLRGSTAMIRDLDPEQAIGRLDPGVKAMAAAVEACGGVVNRVQGDGIMALFGAPIAREDHAIRACLAANRMLAAIAALEIPDLEVRVGVNSGEVVIRATGSDATDYDAVGITVHLAHRLEQSARPGTARLSALTARLARGFTDVLPLGAQEFKGLDAPIEVFELLEATERPAWEVRAAAASLTPFVGRQAEIAMLSAALGRAGLGRGQAVLVVADAGVGKSRLVHEFLREVPSGSFGVLRAAASAHALGSPFQVAAVLLRSWIGAEASDSGATVERRLRQAVALNAGVAALDGPALRALLDLPVEDAEWAALDPARRRERIIEALRVLLLREAAAHPLILVIEDLHWVDDPSRVALDTLAASIGGARLLLLATTRPDYRPAWIGRSYATELSLATLPGEEAETLLRALVGGGEDLAMLRRQIVAQAEGTPLFLEEISRALLEAGLVVRDPGHSRAAPGVTIPASVQAVVASRVDRLPPSQRSLLQVASVIGREVSFDLLRQVAGVLEDRLRADLAGLTSAEFLYEIVLPAAIEYVFKHALTQAVAYDGMLRRHRRELHARVFNALHSSAGDRIGEFTDLLAEHAWRGELWDEAATFAHRAGLRANGRSAWPEAVAFFERGLDALRQLPPDAVVAERRIEILLAARVALVALGELARAAECLAEARAVAAPGGDPVRLAHIDASRCTILTNLGELDEAVAAGRDAHASASGLADAAPLVNVVFGLGQAHWFRGEFVEAERVLTAGLPHVRGAFRTRRTGTTGTASGPDARVSRQDPRDDWVLRRGVCAGDRGEGGRRRYRAAVRPQLRAPCRRLRPFRARRAPRCHRRAGGGTRDLPRRRHPPAAALDRPLSRPRLRRVRPHRGGARTAR